MLDQVINGLKGTGWFFLNPLFYFILLFIGIHAIIRVKRERSDFFVRVYDVMDDFARGIFPGLVVGLIFSVLSVLAGIFLPMGVIATLSFFYILLGLTLRKNYLNAVFAGTLTYVCAAFLPTIHTGIQLLDTWLADLEGAPLGMIALLVALLLVIEGILILSVGAEHTSPILLRGKRGKGIGAHVVSRIWLVPMFVLVPGTAIPTTDWFPFFQLGETGFGLTLVPFAIGFHHAISQSLPEPVVKAIGGRILSLGLILLAGAMAIVYFDVHMFGIVIVALAAVGRMALIFFYRKLEQERAPYFSALNEGIRILGIIPGSPAADMNVAIGERITRVNGVAMEQVEDFYKALQSNAAFCKLEVLDFNGEIRFVQRSLYENDHHELGLLFAQPEKSKRKKAIG